jgi:hypothetical protein
LDRGVFHYFEDLTDADRVRVRRLADGSSRAAWDALVGDESLFTELARTGQRFEWGDAYNEKDDGWASRVLRPRVPWSDDALVLFLESPMWGFETTLDVFVRCWRTFLENDENPVLVSVGRPEVVTFGPGGSGWIGVRRTAG